MRSILLTLTLASIGANASLQYPCAPIFQELNHYAHASNETLDFEQFQIEGMGRARSDFVAYMCADSNNGCDSDPKLDSICDRAERGLCDRL